MRRTTRLLRDISRIDRWALAELRALTAHIRGAYEGFEFHKVFHALNDFCAVTMSAVYLDIIKDRLYTSSPRSAARRSAQSVLHAIADALARLMAPLMPFTAEEVWQELLGLPGGASGRPFSVHMTELPVAVTSDAEKDLSSDAPLLRRWQRSRRCARRSRRRSRRSGRRRRSVPRSGRVS
jgi:isoleucyl-tRNA synthetase